MRGEHLHLIGIGGTGMTALAGLLRDAGARVTGSDGPLYPPTSTILARLGLTVHEGFDAAHLSPAPDLVVVGNAVSRGNPEVEEVLDRGLAYTSMPRLIHERFLGGRHVMVVAGTHGKTTTASMLAWVLTGAGRDPGVLIGGAPLNLDDPFRVGSGAEFVIEGDEYDTAFFDKGPKFMHYKPDTVLLGAVEFDHADIYRDLDDVRTAFRRLVNLVPRRGLIVRQEDSAITREVSDGAFARVEGCGLDQGLWRAEPPRVEDDAYRVRVLRDGRPFTDLELQVFGEHNVRNALAVVAAAHERGLDAAEIRAGLATFRGVRRRLELRGEAAGVRIYDDFAHHPTAVAETLRAVRQRFPRCRLRAVLEPRSWSLRRCVFQHRLVEALREADQAIVARVWGEEAVPADQRLDVGRLVRDLCAAGIDARHVPDPPAIAATLVGDAGPGDVVVVMSNGAFGGMPALLLDGLRARPAVSGP